MTHSLAGSGQRRRLILSAGLCACAAAACPAVRAQAPTASAATPRVLRVGIGLGPDSVQAAGVRRFGELVAARSKGTLRIELHASGELGNDISMVNALRTGTLDMTAPDSATLSSLVGTFSAINYPFTFANEAEADAILDGSWGQSLLDELPEHGLVGLAYWENGFRNLTNSKHAINGRQDFAGLRVRTMQNPLLIDSFDHLGFKAVPLPFTQVYAALRDRLVDGQENPLTTIVSSKFYEVQKYLTLSRHVYSAHVLLIGGPTWKTLNAQQRLLLQAAARDARDYEREMSRSSSDKALAELRAHGMEVTAFTAEDADRLRNALRPVFEQYNQEIGIKTMVALYVELGNFRTTHGSSGASRASR